MMTHVSTELDLQTLKLMAKHEMAISLLRQLVKNEDYISSTDIKRILSAIDDN
jgi:hypothetical protein